MQGREAAKARPERRDMLLGVDVGRRIREARLERGMSLAAVGKTDLSRSFLSQVELGQSRISLRALGIVAERLQLPMSYFLEAGSGDTETQVEIVLNQAESALGAHRPEECLRLLDSMQVPEAYRGQALWMRGRAMRAMRDLPGAARLLTDGIAAADRQHDDSLLPDLHYELGATLYESGAFDEALVHLREAVQRESAGDNDPNVLGKATICMGHILYQRGEIDGAIEHYGRAREVFERMTDLGVLASIYSGLSIAHYQKNDLRAALRYSRLSAGAFQAQQKLYEAAREINNVAVHYQQLGDRKHALEYATDAVRRAGDIGARDIEAMARSTRAAIYLDLGQPEEALSEAAAADQLAVDDVHPGRVDAWLVLALLAEQEGNRERSDELFHRALDVLERSGQHMRYADVALRYSLLLRERGDRDQALEYALEAAQARAVRPA